MKKFIAVALASTMTLAASATVFAANITQETTSCTDTTVTYNVDPTYTVTIPDKVTLGNSADVKVADVVIAKGSKIMVKLTGTSGTDNAFTVKNEDDEELTYTVKNGSTDVKVGDTVLTVNSETAEGSATLDFNAPDADSIKYAGTYTGTVEFTVSVESEIIKFSIAGATYSAEKGMTWAQWVDSNYNTDGYVVSGGYICDDSDTSIAYTVCKPDYSYVSSSDTIEAGTDYKLY